RLQSDAGPVGTSDCSRGLASGTWRQAGHTYLHLYERFLEVYDPELRKQSGSYYTPHQVVEQMVRLTEQALVTRFDKETGFADPTVVTVDPAMGTGTYLDAIIVRVAASVERREGKGAVPAAISALAQRLVGFELQMGPYAVAELRTSGLLDQLEANAPSAGMRMYVTDTLDDPIAEIRYLTAGLEPIAASRRAANAVKNDEPVTVVIGNPPYRERAEGLGGWIEHGDGARNAVAPLHAFRADGNGLAEYVLKNLYVYFWRWGTWKVFDHHRDVSGGDVGIVCFISTSGYLRGPGFKGMRQYLREDCSEGWIIDLTPEGQTPDVPTRVFPGVRQPLAIGLFVRAMGTSTEPAVIRYRAVHGRQAEKFDALAAIDLHDDSWREVRTDWQAPFTPAAAGAWDELPALSDLMPWTAPGVKANRTWVYAPARQILRSRWQVLVTETDPERKRLLFKESRDATLDLDKRRLAGADVQLINGPFASEHRLDPACVRAGYRSLDRQWLIADSRLLHGPSPTLWNARRPGQCFLVEQHSKAIDSGPGVMFSALIPDMDYFNNRGGRTLPMLHANGEPNAAPGLLDALGALVSSEAFSGALSVEELIAYLAGVAAHPGYTARFADELTTPGIRAPLTADPALWAKAVELGRAVVWTHTYGDAMADPASGRPSGDIRFLPDDERRIRNLAAVTEMPTTIWYDEDRRQISLGTGAWGPVSRGVRDYSVGGKNVIRSWFNYRKAVPGGKKTSPLDHIHVDTWPGEWSSEFTDLLSVLTRLVETEPMQAALLDSILDGPLLTMHNLRERGVRWPTVTSDRRPHYGTTEQQADPLPGQLW
ncbi:MAG: N-6 DNA methylase, partial [Acidobacteria bacterium]|nr:N-6 DNA methylase [Acidobacteriota bacterium]